MTTATPPVTRRGRLVPVGLLLLSAVPVLAGAARLGVLAVGEPTPGNARFFDAPLPVVAHVLSVTVYSVGGAFQFSAALRRRRRGRHRATGRVLVPAGLVAALSGIWMTLFYDLPVWDGTRFGALGLTRLAVGGGMAAAIVLAVAAVRRHDHRAHGAWMIRAYALALGAGTQVFTSLPWAVLGDGDPSVPVRAAMMGAGWLINITVAEWVIRRRRAAGYRARRGIRRPAPSVP